MENKTNINWFPGHMTKALREMEKDIKNVDVIFYCLDSRAPKSCLNPKLSLLAKDKKIIYVLTKSDLVDETKLEKFKQNLTTDKSLAVFLNSTQSNTSKFLFEKAKLLLKDKFEKAQSKGLSFVIKAMVVGVPNVGKSTLINNFCKKSKAQTGDKPGVTKAKQWLSSFNGEIMLLDTPGTLWPSFENEKTARNLAYIGSIKEEVLDLTDLAFYFIKDIVKIDKTLLENRYNIKIKCENIENMTNDDILKIFDDICFNKKLVLKGNEPDYDRCAKLLINDFRQNKLGKIILD